MKPGVIRLVDCKIWVSQCDSILFAGKLVLRGHEPEKWPPQDASNLLGRIVAAGGQEVVRPRDPDIMSHLIVKTSGKHALGGAPQTVFVLPVSKPALAELEEVLVGIQSHEMKGITLARIRKSESTLLQILQALEKCQVTA